MKAPGTSAVSTSSSFWLKLARALCAALFVYAGVSHFTNPEPFCKIVPEGLPAPLMLVYISGVAEILGGIGLLVKPVRRLAVWGLLLLLLAVFPANVNMAVHPDLLGHIPLWLLYCRLPLQVVLMLWVWFCRDR